MVWLIVIKDGDFCATREQRTSLGMTVREGRAAPQPPLGIDGDGWRQLHTMTGPAPTPDNDRAR